VSHALICPDPIAGHVDPASSAFVCFCTDDGLDAAWVHVAGELDFATAPQLDARQRGRRLVLLRGSPDVDRLFTLAGRSDAVEIGDLDLPPAEPPVHLLQRSLVSSSLLRTG
jgi:hypothetical protein